MPPVYQCDNCQECQIDLHTCKVRHRDSLGAHYSHLSFSFAARNQTYIVMMILRTLEGTSALVKACCLSAAWLKWCGLSIDETQCRDTCGRAHSLRAALHPTYRLGRI